MTKNSINFTQLNKLSRPLAKSSLKIHSNNVEEFPKGTQARVYRTSAGVVTKFIRLDSKDESTVRFYRLISEHQNNFLFPRIFSAKLYEIEGTLENGTMVMTKDYWLIVQMEELFHLNKISTENRFVKQLLENSGISVESKYRILDNEDTLFHHLFFVIRDLFQKGKNESIQGDVKYEVRGSQIPKFIGEIRAIMRFQTVWDLGVDNYMVRLTKTGPQLVMLDPIKGA